MDAVNVPVIDFAMRPAWFAVVHRGKLSGGLGDVLTGNGEALGLEDTEEYIATGENTQTDSQGDQ